MDDYQFYPTTHTLAHRAWGKFRNKNFIRVLEPSAGEGDLAEVASSYGYQYSKVKVDCVEIDITRHDILRAKGFNVVGFDFLQFGSGSMYSHIVMNPPFKNGVIHVLKAFDILWNGEVVAILNAETIRNPATKEKKLLAKYIDQYGSVEFVENAFSNVDAERKTSVDVALVYLCKKADINQILVGSITEDLTDDNSANELGSGYVDLKEIAIPNSTIENLVKAFNAAVLASKGSVYSEARAAYYARLLGDTMAQRNGKGETETLDSSSEWVMNQLYERYDSLKDRAWTSILRSSKVTDRLSTKVQDQVESEFESVKSLEFTVSNIYGFLQGLTQSQGEIQTSMCCDVYDQITRYHTDNIVFFKGWKSNDKHRTCGMRLKTTRFILPGFGIDSWQTRLSWEASKRLSDFDKVFALLDGKAKPEISLNYIFEHDFKELRLGQRISSSYFDCRFYPAAGTVHFFPRSKKLIDRLNRIVGRHRQWLPPEDKCVNDAFWLQYDKAEKFDKEVRAEIKKQGNPRHFWRDPVHTFNSSDVDEAAKAIDVINNAVDEVLSRRGIDVDKLLEPSDKSRLISAA